MRALGFRFRIRDLGTVPRGRGSFFPSLKLNGCLTLPLPRVAWAVGGAKKVHLVVEGPSITSQNVPLPDHKKGNSEVSLNPKPHKRALKTKKAPTLECLRGFDACGQGLLAGRSPSDSEDPYEPGVLSNAGGVTIP